jgi:hypothetical protein
MGDLSGDGVDTELLTAGVDHVTFSSLCSRLQMHPCLQRNTMPYLRRYHRRTHPSSTKYLLALI